MKTITPLAGILMLLLTGISSAANLPGYYPDGFQRTGTIDRVNISHRDIVVNDTQYQLAEGVALHSLSEKSDSLARLRKGTKIGFSYSGHDVGRTITEIWMLPGYYGESRE